MQTFYLVVLTTVVIGVIGYSQALPLDENPELRKSCTNLCEHCGCVGYYCGDECICECDVTGNNGESSCNGSKHWQPH